MLLLQPFLGGVGPSIGCGIIRTERNFTGPASPDDSDSSKQNTTYRVSDLIAHYVGHGTHYKYDVRLKQNGSNLIIRESC